VSVVSVVVSNAGCARAVPRADRARNLIIITIDTLRADHVGAYGYRRSRTPTLDALAARGVVFERAYSAAPITLTSHATLMTGRYPPGHGARDNGMHVSATVPTLATTLREKGFRTAAFVAAFPLDHQFGLNRGFDVYGDQFPRAANGQLMNERPASKVVDDAIAWLASAQHAAPSTQHPAPFFLWVHFFEPHAPYGDPTTGRSTIDRYDDEIAIADREAGRLLAAVGEAAADTAVIVAGDHGEAFGEHGEYAHSIFVYDTTLRVPLIVSSPSALPARVAEPVTLADVAPTAARLVGDAMTDVDGIDLSPAWTGGALPHRELYAESFAPLVEFGWAPLRSIRSDRWKFVAAPAPELFDLTHDAAEDHNVASQEATVVRQLDQRADRYSPPSLAANASAPPDAAERLRALGYSSSSQQPAASNRPDPKQMKELAARIAQVTSGELSGDALVSALETISRADPANPQAHLRLGFAYLQRGDCARAVPQLSAAANAGLPSADAFLGLATCYGQHNDLAGAERALAEAKRLEPDNPIVTANIGILQLSRNQLAPAIASLTAALARDPGLDEARFNLAVAYAKAGRRNDAAAAARDLLARLPPNAPQRAEVERLLRAIQ
jgi:arylsulfatase A-like enzyme/cytochrome c-type biogenesis protein CcmH/NrfG